MRISRAIAFASMLALGLAGVGLAGMAAHSGAQKTRVTVTEVEYKLTLSPTHLMPGTVTFVVVDKGKLAHSLAISGPGIKNRRLSGTVKPGASGSLTVALKAGTYTLWCPVPGHAALGMKTTVKVGSATTTTGGTTTKSAWA